MVKIRLKRLGRKKTAFYRVVVTDIRNRRDGAPIAELGFYDPMRKQLKLDKAAALAWVAKGAQPSETVAYLLTKAAEDGSLVELPKKEKKQHMGEANQSRPTAAKAPEVEVVEVKEEVVAAPAEEAVEA
jgi:small subunit ribosomal protein S16